MALTASRTAEIPASRLPRSTGTSEPSVMMWPRIGTLNNSFFTITEVRRGISGQCERRIEIGDVIRHEDVGARGIDFFEAERSNLYARDARARR